MTFNRHLYFLPDIAKDKHKYQDHFCPFCNREELSEILDQNGSILLVKNKFPVFADTVPTVLIETDDCSANIATYDTAHMRNTITFGINQWLNMEESGEYKSVVFYKNHGPLSGGSIDHAHMQIVGLKNIDYRHNLRDDIFEGIDIYREGDCLLNISTKPNASATEFNVIVPVRNDNFMSTAIQNTVKYLLTFLKCTSYNLFFYQWKDSIICKAVPRFITSPYLVGFSIAQTTSRIREIAEEVKGMYYSF